MADKLIVQLTGNPPNLTELHPTTNGMPTQIVAPITPESPPVAWSWGITQNMTDDELRGLGIYRVDPAEPPHGQEITRYHFEMQGDHVVQVIDETKDVPVTAPSDALAIAQYANQRLDAGVQAGLASVQEMEARVSKKRMPRDLSMQTQIDDLQTQIDGLASALRATLQAQTGRQPR